MEKEKKEENLLDQQDQKVYIGKILLSPSGIKELKNAVDYKVYKIDILVGCECDDEVGDRTAEKKKNDNEEKSDSSIKKMYIGGDLLHYLQTSGDILLGHMYVTYFTPSTSGDGYILSAFVDLEGKTPLEKLTVYTSGKSQSTEYVGQNKPIIDTSKVVQVKDTIPIVSKDTLPSAADSAGKQQKKKKQIEILK